MWSSDFRQGFHSFIALFMNPDALSVINEEQKRGYHMAKSVHYNGGFISMEEAEELNDKLLPVLQKRWGKHFCPTLNVKIPASKDICWFCSDKVKRICGNRQKPQRSSD